jgi:hypothetical protein
MSCEAKEPGMVKVFTIALVLVTSLSLLSCQKYSSGLVQSAGRADEAVALSNLRSIMLAQNAYNLSTGSYGTFEQLTSGAFLDARFKGERPSLSDYSYTMTVTEKSDDAATPMYRCNADPERTGDRAGRHFYVDSTSSEIHTNTTQPASAADEIIKP